MKSAARHRSVLAQVVCVAFVLSVVTSKAVAANAVPAPPAPQGQIAFSKTGPSGINSGQDIYVVNADGTGLTRLTRFNKYALAPTWSPDGTRIAFVGILPGRGGRYGPHDIYVMNADGSGIRKITDSTVENVSPSWSPDGTTIAFVRKPAGLPWAGDVWLMNPDGTGLVQVTSGSVERFGQDYRPTWSPDGSRLAFERSTFAEGIDAIYVVNRDGTGLTEVFEGVCCTDPIWSPDGKRIAFWNSTVPALQTIDLASRRITTLADADDLGGVTQPLEWSTWSPDGAWLALAACCNGFADAYLVAADGSAVIHLPNGQGASDPAWRPSTSG